MFSSITLDADLRASDLSVFIADIFPNDDKTVKKQTDARNREKMLQILNPCSIFFFFSCCWSTTNLCYGTTQVPFEKMLMRHISVAEQFVEEHDFNSA